MKRVIKKAMCSLFIVCLCLLSITDKVDANIEIKDSEIEDIMDQSLNEGKIPGCAVGIIKDGQVVYCNSFGYADIENKEKVTNETMFEIGSCSKAFTGIAVLKLIDEGKIHMTDQISAFFPWLVMKYKGQKVEVTVEQLLYQTSGIPFYTIDLIPPDTDSNALENSVRKLVNIELDSLPGEQFQYASMNYDILGFIIQYIEQCPYEQYMVNEIFQKLNLNHTTFYSLLESSDSLADGYKLDFLEPQKCKVQRFDGNNPAAYVLSNITDMCTWLQIQINGDRNQFLSEEILQESHKWNSNSLQANGSRYGAGWFTYDDSFVFHSGNNPTYSASIMFRPKDKIGVVVLCNINTDYTSSACQKILNLVNQETMDIQTYDLNQTVAKVDIFVAIGLFLFIFLLIIRDILLIRAIYQKKRVYYKPRWIKFSILCFVYALGILFVYLLPRVCYKEVSWKFLMLWLPTSLTYIFYGICFFFGLLFLAIVLTNFSAKAVICEATKKVERR